MIIQNFKTLLANYSHLKGVQIYDNDVKPHLPVHIVLEEESMGTDLVSDEMANLLVNKRSWGGS